MQDVASKILALQENGCFYSRELVCFGMLAPHETHTVSMAQFGLLMGFWIFASAMDRLLDRTFEAYRLNSQSKRKNTQTYILELIVSTALLIYIICRVPRIITLEKAGEDSFSPDEAKACGYCINVIVALYVFEFIHRDEMNGWLGLHHFVTIVWGSAACSMLYETVDLVGVVMQKCAVLSRPYFSD